MFREIKTFINWGILYPLLRNSYKGKRRALINHMIKRYGGKPVRKSDFKKYKTSETIFILGAGQSINNLTKLQLGEISNHDSISMNAFGYHAFSPTFHSFELENQHIVKVLDMFKGTAQNIMNNWFTDNDVKVIFRTREFEEETLVEFVKYLQKRDCLYWGDFDIIPGRSKDEYRFYLKYYRRLGLFNKDDYFPNKSSSLSWCISFAHGLGYKNIVLCGIDLFGDHFHINKNRLTKLDIDKLHLTNDPNRTNVTISDLLLVWKEEIFGPAGVKLYSANEFSLLSKILPIYWNNN